MIDACDWCWERKEIRMYETVCGLIEPTPICEDCFAQQDSELAFYTLQSLQDYLVELDDIRADHEHDRRRDDRRNP